MTKPEILERLETNHNQFISYLDSLNESDFEYAFSGKWSAGQQLKHIVLSVKPLAQGFLLPRFLLKIIFGKANRPSKTYDDLVLKYDEKIKLGGRASAAFLPKVVNFSEKDKLYRTLMGYLKTIKNSLENYTEEDFDLMILPHPLLGKITVREMLYFTAHHVVHHEQLIKLYLSQKV
jgi:hypothetical protein